MQHTDHCRDHLCQGCEEINPSPLPYCSCGLIKRIRNSMYKDHMETFRLGYTAALRDAVEAINGIPDNFESSAEWDRDYDVDPTGQTSNPRIWIREAIAVIETLGEEQ